MMSELFDEEYQRKRYDASVRKEAFAKGKAEGKAEGTAEGKFIAAKNIAEKLRKMGLSEEQIKEATAI